MPFFFYAKEFYHSGQKCLVSPTFCKIFFVFTLKKSYIPFWVSCLSILCSKSKNTFFALFGKITYFDTWAMKIRNTCLKGVPTFFHLLKKSRPLPDFSLDAQVTSKWKVFPNNAQNNGGVNDSNLKLLHCWNYI